MQLLNECELSRDGGNDDLYDSQFGMLAVW